ncbi:hypothetical protein HC256_004386 [Beauveria bassiana]|nr:hypothetical protein HC256_004386 [Beauveria bassiana]
MTEGEGQAGSFLLASRSQISPLKIIGRCSGLLMRSSRTSTWLYKRFRATGSHGVALPAYERPSAFEFLLGKLEDAKSQIETHPAPKQFGININLGWMKLDKYYNTLRDSPVYYAAAALHPGLRWTYLDEIWGRHHPEWVEEAKQLVQQL